MRKMIVAAILAVSLFSGTAVAGEQDSVLLAAGNSGDSSQLEAPVGGLCGTVTGLLEAVTGILGSVQPPALPAGELPAGELPAVPTSQLADLVGSLCGTVTGIVAGLLEAVTGILGSVEAPGLPVEVPELPTP